jgi:hypothetical protein
LETTPQPPAEPAPNDSPPFAWQPLTPHGVAAFAQASFGRLLLVQSIVALLAAIAVALAIHSAWFPVINEAISHLPAQGEIRSGRLDWRGDSPVTLAEGRSLAFAVDLKHEGKARSPAHLEVEFGQTDFKIFSLFGFAQSNYPRAWLIAFNLPELKPRWGAWAPVLLALAIGAVIVALLLSWAFLATLYLGVPWLIAFFANRALGLGGAWRLAGAALLPGALFFSGSIILYGLGALDLIRLLAAAAVHFVIGWLYLAISPFFLPRHPEAAAQKTNPFAKGGRET